MRLAFSRTGAAAALAIRVAALAILALQALRPLGILSKPALSLFFILICSAAGYILPSLPFGKTPGRRLRPWALAAALTLLPFALRLLGGWILQATALLLCKTAPEAAHRAEFLLLSLDQAFWPLSAIAAWAGLSAALTLRRPSFRGIEPLLNALFFLAVFWREAGFSLALYDHPAKLALAAGSIVILEVLRLVLDSAAQEPSLSGTAMLAAGSQTHSPEKRRVKRIISPLAVGALMLILFLLLLGRWNQEASRSGGGLVQPNLFSFDFSRFIRLEPEISMDNKTLVLLVRKDETDPNWLTRRFVLSGYTRERGFYVDEAPWVEDLPQSLPGREREYQVGTSAGRLPLEQEYYILNFDPQAFIAMNAPRSSVPLAPWAGASFKSIYRAESLVPAFEREASLAEADGTRSEAVPPPGMDEAEWRYWCQWGDDARIRDLALRLTEGKDDYWGKALAIQSYLQSEYLYSLKPGIAPDGDQLGHFLFTSRKGYCSYFAFSMTLMLRSLGVPTRVAAGFFIRPDAGILSLYPVRSDMAHAWVEVYFPGYGWIDFDPTSSNLAPGEGLSMGDLPDPASYLPLVQEILQNRDSLLPTETGPTPRDAAEGLAALLSRAARGALRHWYLVLPLLLMAGIALANLVLALPLLLSRRGMRRRAAAFSLLLARRRRCGFRRARGSTRLEYCRSLDAAFTAARASGTIPSDTHARLALLAEANLHGPDFSPEDEAAWDEALRDAKNAFRAAVPAWRRIASILFIPLPSVRAFPQALVLLLLSILLVAQSGMSPDPGAGMASAAELLELAETALWAEDWEGAETLYKRGMALHPAVPAFPRNLGRLYRDKELYGLAFDTWRKAELLEPGDANLAYDMSWALARLNRDAEAVSYLERCLSLDPDNLDAISDLGWEYFKVHRTTDGLELLRKATEDFGFSRSFAMTMGTLHSEAYEYEESKRQYMLAIEDAEKNWAMRFASVAWYNLSILESRFYRFDQARVAADRAISSWDRSSARLASGELWQRRMRLGSARREYSIAAETDDSPLSELALAEINRLSGDPAGAIHACRTVLERENKTWMANFGTDPEAHAKDILDIMADALDGQWRVELSRPASGPLDRLRSLLSAAGLRARAWHARERYRRLSWNVAEAYRREGSILLSEVNAYNAMEGHPALALRHLGAARDYEAERIPAALPSYIVEEGILKRRPRAVLEAIKTLDGVYERDIMVDALLRSGPLARNRGLRAALGLRLFALAPGMLRQAGLSIYASIILESDDARLERRVKTRFLPMLAQAGIRRSKSGDEESFALKLSIEEGKLHCRFIQSEDGSLLGAWSGNIGSGSRKELAAAATAFLAAAFADPGL